MGYLQEVEALDCLIDNLRIAAQAADDIATRPKSGRTYRELRDALAKVEGACRQVGHNRGDFRWMQIGMMMHEAHTRAGEWLRGVKVEITVKVPGPDGVEVKTAVPSRRPITMGQKHPLFVKLAENLRFLRANAEKLRTAATGIIGPVLPDVGRAERKIGAPVAVQLPPGMVKTKAGLIVPQGVSVQ